MSDPALKELVQHQFAPNAEAYVASTVHANQPDLERMVKLAALRGDERVLDVATGGGHTALAFAPYVHEVVATDLTPAMLHAAERFITGKGVQNVRFERADAEALPYPNEAFDVVTCRVAPHHFGDVQGFVREAARVLKAGGVFILDDTIAPTAPELDVFINEIEKLRDPSHVRDYTVAEWQAFCANAGLVVEHVETWTKAIPFDDWCERMRVPPDVRTELNRRLIAAPEQTRTTFAIEIENNRVREFALHSTLLSARKP